MKGEDYPALYQATDEASVNAQSYFLCCIKAYITLLVIGAAMSLKGINSKAFAITAAFIFFLTLILTIIIATKHFERSWYQGRAAAESIKTSTWRFMMRAEPFEDSKPNSSVKEAFITLLKEILYENKELARNLGGQVSSKEQITDTMLSIRALLLEKRKEFYREHRIDEQRQWYATTSKNNNIKKKRWFILIGVLLCFAIITILLRIGYPTWDYWPTEIFAVAAGGVLTWIQVKRFQELSAAYALAAHEIGMIKARYHDISTEEEFLTFVKDSENAFSREHTQWVARRDS